jgi:hypothetical protein
MEIKNTNIVSIRNVFVYFWIIPTWNLYCDVPINTYSVNHLEP